MQIGQSFNGTSRKEIIKDLSKLGIEERLVYEIGFDDRELSKLLAMMKTVVALKRDSDATWL